MRDPRGGGGPILINHPGGPFYAWRNDNYWGDNYGVETIRFYAAQDPDLVAKSLTWDTANAGVNFSYAISNADLTVDTTAALYWANGASLIGNPVYSTTIARPQGNYGPFFVPSHSAVPGGPQIGDPPASATHLVLIVDPPLPNGTVAESDENNNVFPLPINDISAKLLEFDPQTSGFLYGYNVARNNLTQPLAVTSRCR